MDTLIIDKLRKIEKLANCGIDGERKNAAKMLRDLLSRHGLTLEDLAEENKKEYRMNYRTIWEKMLLIQIYAKVIGSSRITYSKHRNKTGIFFKMSVPQYIDFMAMYKTYRPALKKEIDTLCSAFFAKHDIFGPSPKNYEDQKLDKEESKRIWRMAMGLRDVVMLNMKLIEGGDRV